MAEGKGVKNNYLRAAAAGKKRIAKAGFKAEASRADAEMKGIANMQRAKKKAADKSMYAVDKIGKKPVRRSSKRSGMR